MPKRSPAAAARDILGRIDRIEGYLDGVSREEFLADWMRRDAVERNIEVISEASRDLPADLRLREGEPPWRAIADVGNVYRHEYDNIDPDTLWNTATMHVPALRAPVERILDALRAQEGRDGPPAP